MSDEMRFLLAVAVSIVISCVVLSVMLKPLRSILAQLCAEATGTQFWLSFTAVMLFLAPLLVTLVGFDPATASTGLGVVRRAAIGALAAAIAALLVIGQRISRSSEDAARLARP